MAALTKEKTEAEQAAIGGAEKTKQQPVTQQELQAVLNSVNVSSVAAANAGSVDIRAKLANLHATIGAILERPFISPHAIIDSETGLPIEEQSKLPKVNRDGSVEEPTDPEAKAEFEKNAEAGYYKSDATKAAEKEDSDKKTLHAKHK